MKKLVLFSLFGLFGWTATAQKASPATKSKSISDYYLTFASKSAKKTVNDTKNGYIKFEEPAAEGWAELVMWRWAGGKDLIGRSTVGCGPACGIEVSFFYGDAPKTDVSDAVLPKAELETLFKKFEKVIEETDTDELRQKDGKIYVGNATRWYKLPQSGRTLQIGFMVNQNSGMDKFVPIANLEPKGDKFVITKKMELKDFK
jgi:hypothetical protein